MTKKIDANRAFEKMDAQAEDLRGGLMDCDALTTQPFKNATRAASVLIKCALKDIVEQFNEIIEEMESEVESATRRARVGATRYR